MIEEIRQNLFKIDVVLPQSPLKSLNAYLIKGLNRHLLIDTGYNRKECFEDLTNGLAKIGVTMSETDLFLTHLHADHTGLVSGLTEPTTRVFCSETDAMLINRNMLPYQWQARETMMNKYGFPAEKIKVIAEIHPAKKFGSVKEISFIYVSDGNTLVVGDYRLTCISTPGHSPGHMCLYDREHKILFSGDHILGDITPNISKWMDSKDSLGQYFSSLNRLVDLDVELILPGHRRPLRDLNKRINELKDHHEQRLNELKYILRHGPLNAYQAASRMKWDLPYDTWDQIPVTQQWFATGEAISHLEHLVELNTARRLAAQETLQFELS